MISCRSCTNLDQDYVTFKNLTLAFSIIAVMIGVFISYLLYHLSCEESFRLKDGLRLFEELRSILDAIIYVLFIIAFILLLILQRYKNRNYYLFLDTVGLLHCHRSSPFVLRKGDTFYTWATEGLFGESDQDELQIDFFHVKSFILVSHFKGFFRAGMKGTLIPPNPDKKKDDQQFEIVRMVIGYCGASDLVEFKPIVGKDSMTTEIHYALQLMTNVLTWNVGSLAYFFMEKTKDADRLPAVMTERNAVSGMLTALGAEFEKEVELKVKLVEGIKATIKLIADWQGSSNSKVGMSAKRNLQAILDSLPQTDSAQASSATLEPQPEDPATPTPPAMDQMDFKRKNVRGIVL